MNGKMERSENCKEKGEDTVLDAEVRFGKGLRLRRYNCELHWLRLANMRGQTNHGYRYLTIEVYPEFSMALCRILIYATYSCHVSKGRWE